MRQLLCTRRAGITDRRWLAFTMLSALLLWLAASDVGLVNVKARSRPARPTPPRPRMHRRRQGRQPARGR